MSHRVAVLLLACLAAPAFAQDAASSSPPAWELKGIALGDSHDQVLAALPNAECDVKPFDTGLMTCMDWNNTLAGKKAVVMVKLLEGKVVYVNVGNIDLDQAKDAAAALVAKFGPATSIERVEGQRDARARRNDLYTTTEAYSWVRGHIYLEVQPFAWANKAGTTFAAVILRDDDLHDHQWVVRFNSQGRKADDI